jgi:hypothetical protein
MLAIEAFAIDLQKGAKGKCDQVRLVLDNPALGLLDNRVTDAAGLHVDKNQRGACGRVNSARNRELGSIIELCYKVRAPFRTGFAGGFTGLPPFSR